MPVTAGRRCREAEAILDPPADARTVRPTITDDAALPRFMPGIRACRVHERHAPGKDHEKLVVEQAGGFRFLRAPQHLTAGSR